LSSARLLASAGIALVLACAPATPEENGSATPARSGGTSPRDAAASALSNAAAAAGALADAGAPHRFHFTDVAREAGLDRVLLAGRPGKDHVLDSAGAGVAFLDYDRDGVLDIYLPNSWRLEGKRIAERGRAALYRGVAGGRFEDVTAAAGVEGEGRWGTGVVAADYDGDGWTDLLVTSFERNLLYRNLGGRRFENVAARVGVEAPGWNTGAAFFDADSDGDLDLYVAGYVDCAVEDVLEARPTLDWKGLEKVAFGPFGLEGAPDHFFRQEGGRFVDATEAAGLTDRGLGYGYAVRAADFDDDGDLDLYVANDSDPNYLYRNEGDGTFREVGVWSGCALDGKGTAQASMGIAAADVFGTGWPDLFVSNFAEDFSTLYRNLGDGMFEDASEQSGVGPATYAALSWGVAFADFDHDGDLDLAIANGHIYPQIDRHPEVAGTFAQRNLLLENRGGVFHDVTDAAGPGFAVELSSRGLAVGDYDNDGDLDLLISNLDAPPTLLRNDDPTGTWLTVIVEGPNGGPAPPGTQVEVRAGGQTYRRFVSAGDSYASSHDPRVHVGLGAAAKADEVVVTWPDGQSKVVRGVAARAPLLVRAPQH
jgi:hypothetical protein